MQQKTDAHIFQGMQQDLDPHKHKPEYLVDAHNIRITSRGEDTEFAITSEKSTEIISTNSEIMGSYIGHCVIDKYIVLFTHSDVDRIYRIEQLENNHNSFTVTLLYYGNLGFDENHPIEAIGTVENDKIIKVYWTDGKNQPRMINILNDYSRYVTIDNFNPFDFSPTLKLNEECSVTKDTGATGSFPAGVLQYAFTYYNKYGQESNIVWQSPLIYTSFTDRAGSPEETISNAFRINIENPDTNFDYIRLYSITRTSLNAQPTVKSVADVPIIESLIENSGYVNSLARTAEINSPDAVLLRKEGKYENVTSLTPVKLSAEKLSGFQNWAFPSEGSYYIINKADGYDEIVIKSNGTALVYNWGDAGILYVSADRVIFKDFDGEYASIYGVTARTHDNTDHAHLSLKESYKIDVAPISSTEVKIGSSWETAVSPDKYLVKDVSTRNTDILFNASGNSYCKVTKKDNVFYLDNTGVIKKVLWDNADTIYVSVDNQIPFDKVHREKLAYNQIVGYSKGKPVSLSSEDAVIGTISDRIRVGDTSKLVLIWDRNSPNYVTGTAANPIEVDSRIKQCSYKAKIGSSSNPEEEFWKIEFSEWDNIQLKIPKPADEIKDEEKEYTFIWTGHHDFNWYHTVLLISKNRTSDGQFFIYLVDKDKGENQQYYTDSNGNQKPVYIPLQTPALARISNKEVNVPDTSIAKPSADDVDKSFTLVRKTSKNTITIIDNGLSSSNIDPSELLYKGGEDVAVETICQKDGTLFLGNIEVNRPPIINLDIPKDSKLTTGERSYSNPDTGAWYPNDNTLSKSEKSENNIEKYINTSTFKSGEKYRFGIQFQYKNGKWSNPIHIEDYTIERGHTKVDKDEKGNRVVKIPTVKYSIDLSKVKALGYKKVRGLVVCPTLQDRKIITQGVLCPTVYNTKDRHSNSPYAQSSWFIRPFSGKEHTPFIDFGKGNLNQSALAFKHNELLYGGTDSRAELQGTPAEFNGKFLKLDKKGKYVDDEGNEFTVDKIWGKWTNYEYKDTIDFNDTSSNAIFAVDQSILTFHSADLQFDDDIKNLDFSALKFNTVGYISDVNSASDITLQTSTATLNNSGSGFMKNSFSLVNNSRTLGAYAGYEDSLIIDRFSGEFTEWDSGLLQYFIYPWQRSGSINNDMNRPANKGTRTSVLKTKKLSDIKIFKSTSYAGSPTEIEVDGMDFFYSDQLAVSKLKDNIYYGNIDTMIAPVLPYNPYWAAVRVGEIEKPKNPENSTTSEDENTTSSYVHANITRGHVYNTYGTTYGYAHDTIINANEGQLGTVYDDAELGITIGDASSAYKNGSKESIRMKYKSSPHIVIKLQTKHLEAPKDVEGSSLWLGEIIREADPTFGGNSKSALRANLWIPAGDAIDIEGSGNTTIEWKYGDTFFQRFDFLKTYAFTQEDENSIIEIGSFMGEFRVNADGRYDRNRGQTSNINMSPQNFNLHNPVYSQLNNFFNYRILDEDYYKLNSYPNTFTWTLEHKAAEEVDNWTTITLASTQDADGSMGEITAIRSFNGKLYAFQNSGISNILFNSRVQLQASDGVPIEISNNYKVDGIQYITDSIGCTNKWSICNTPSGLYFIDSNSRELYNIGGNGLANISANRGMSNWFHGVDFNVWSPNHTTGARSFYDFSNNDLYVNVSGTTLNYSEKLGQFVSFFDYQKASALFNVKGEFYGAVSNNDLVTIYRLFASDNPCNLFNEDYSYGISFISNAESVYNKIFTNLEMRADWRNLDNLSDGTGVNYDRATNMYDFFDYIRVSNEYQDTGLVPLTHLRERPSNLKNKFRIWRISLPRDVKHRRDRISNPWAKITLFKSKDNIGNNPFILHDLNVQYYL